MKELTIEEFLIKQISDSPNIRFGTLYRDVCITSSINRSKYNDDIFKSIKNALDYLENNNIIISEHRDNDTFYNLGKQLKREKILQKLGIL